MEFTVQSEDLVCSLLAKLFVDFIVEHIAVEQGVKFSMEGSVQC